MAPGDKKKKDGRAWEALTPPLAQWIVEYVQTKGFGRMTPVQSATIPLLVANKDVVVEAVTGSGKTLAFLIPLVTRLLRASEASKKHQVAGVVVAPTRELATQIHAVLVDLIQFHPASAELLPFLLDKDEVEKRPMTTEPVLVPQLLVGGTYTTAEDLRFFLRHSPNILIATPGRLVEMLASPYVKCPQSSFELLVLDEADRLLDLGFKADLQRILACLPKQRRTGLFSASMSEAVEEVIRVGLRNPAKVVVTVKSLKTGGVITERRTPASLTMTYLTLPTSHKLPALTQLLDKLDPRPSKSVVFLSTCAAVDYFSHVLPSLLPSGYALIPLHGQHVPKVRQKNFRRFLESSQPTILLTTDMAARGLDIPCVDLVVQLDPPSDPKVFAHRCGRAGRAGRKGLAVVFLEGREKDYASFLEIRQTPIVPLTHIAVSTTTEDAEEFTRNIREMVRTDRAIYDKAQKAFVSWVRSYCKHAASSIFDMRTVDWADLGRGWGLLRLPKMPEARSWEGDRSLGVLDMDWETFGYKDKAREKTRIAELEKAKEDNGGGGGGGGGGGDIARKVENRTQRKRKNAEAWSERREKEGGRVTRREKKEKKRDAVRRGKMTEEERLGERELGDLVAEVRRRNGVV